MKTIAAIQARLGSTRLSEKVLADLNGQPMVMQIARRLAASEAVDEVVLATTTDPSDDRLADTVEALGLRVHRGAVDDLVALALEHDVARLTLRCTLPADLQPKLQGSLDRQLSRRHGRRRAFLCHAGQGPDVHLLCVGPTVQEGKR